MNQNLNVPMAIELLEGSKINWTSIHVDHENDRIDWKNSESGEEGYVINVGEKRGVYGFNAPSIL